MIEIKGSYTTAVVYTEELDDASISQIFQICNQKSMEGCHIAIMPDVHMGSSCCVGTTIALKDKVIPSLVGVDIGCGMEVVKLKEKHIELARLDKFIRAEIPSGCNIRNKIHKRASKLNLRNLYCFHAIDELRSEKSLGTLGGGNHFIEIDADEDGCLYLVIHSGSRHLGVEVASYYQKLAYDHLNGCDEASLKTLKDSLKKQGREQQYAAIAKTLKNTKKTDIPYVMSYLEGEYKDAYLHDIKIIQEFADISRQAIAEDIMKYMKLHTVERFMTMHNYIDEDQVLRKGAIRAGKDEIVWIPLNMRDGALLCKGKGNPQWNASAPHGAGRAMSRSEAKQSFTLSEYKKEMKGIFTSSVVKSTIDECPMAYKPADQIISQIEDSVEILKKVRPIYNFKAGEDE